MTEAEKPRRLQPRHTTFHWSTSSPLEPHDLQRIVEDLGRYAADSLPGSVISAIAFDGIKLDITLREAS